MFKNAKKDDNHRQIISDLQRIGFSILETHQLGGGAPDAIIALAGNTAALEIKSEKGKLNKLQDKFRLLWKGKYIVAKNSGEVLANWFPNK